MFAGIPCVYAGQGSSTTLQSVVAAPDASVAPLAKRPAATSVMPATAIRANRLLDALPPIRLLFPRRSIVCSGATTATRRAREALGVGPVDGVNVSSNEKETLGPPRRRPVARLRPRRTITAWMGRLPPSPGK